MNPMKEENNKIDYVAEDTISKVKIIVTNQKTYLYISQTKINKQALIYVIAENAICKKNSIDITYLCVISHT